MFVSLFENDFMSYDKYGNVGSNIKTNTRLYTVCQWNIKTSSTFCYSVPFLKEYFLWKQKKQKKKQKNILQSTRTYVCCLFGSSEKRAVSFNCNLRV